MAGWTGKILRVNLSTGVCSDVDTMNYTDRFIGGHGIADKIHFDEVGSKVGVYDPEATVVIMTGPLTGTLAPGNAGIVAIVGITPLQWPEPLYCYSFAGGSFGSQLKFAGYDGVIIQGKASSPVYIWVNDGVAEVKSATGIWGQDTSMTQIMLKEIHGKDTGILTCGPAGEHLVRWSALVTGTGSTMGYGFGSTFGAKNLKAVAVRGTGGVSVHDSKKLIELREYVKGLHYPKYYTDCTKRPLEQGAQDGRYTTYGVNHIRPNACFGCAIGGCKDFSAIPNMAAFESCCSATSTYRSLDRAYNKSETILTAYFSGLSNRLGFDTKHLGDMFSWLSGCYKAGILTDENTGLPLSKMGSLEFANTFLYSTAKREGFGNVVAEGLGGAVDIVGKDSEKYVPWTGLTRWRSVSDGYDPQQFRVSALLYGMDTRRPIGSGLHTYNWTLRFASGLSGPEHGFWIPGCGGDPGEVPPPLTPAELVALGEKYWGSKESIESATETGKAQCAINVQNHVAARHSMIGCDWTFPIYFSHNTPNHLGPAPYELECKLLSAVTGRNISESELEKVAERSFLLHRATLMKRGRTRNDDQYPDYIFTTNLYPKGVDVVGPGGEQIKVDNPTVDRNKYDEMFNEYYKLRGWNVTTGMPGRKRFEELDLKDVADDLENKYGITLSP